MTMDKFHKISKDVVIHNLVNLRQLVFEVTDRCNLHCRYCAYADLYQGFDQRNNVDLPFHKAKLIIDYLQNLWSENRFQDMEKTLTISFYGGEPLLNMGFIKNVIEYVEKLPQTGRVFKYSMTTNAMLLNRHMDYLVEKNFALLISLDGDEQGQSYRTNHVGNNSFQRVFRNIMLLRKEYPKFWGNNINFNAVLHDRNGVERTYKFYKKYIGKTPVISPVNPAGVREDKQDEFRQIYCNIPQEIRQSPICEQIENELFIRAPRIASLINYVHRHSGNFYRNYIQLAIDREKLFRYSTGTCTPFAKKMFITVNGKILPCERISHDYAIGQITDTDILLDCEQIAEQHNQHTSRYLKQCKHCAISRHCRVCVYQEYETNRGSSLCSSFMTEEQLEAELCQSLAYLEEHPKLYKRILNEVSIGG